MFVNVFTHTRVRVRGKVPYLGDLVYPFVGQVLVFLSHKKDSFFNLNTIYPLKSIYFEQLGYPLLY